jgi:3-methyladenine DNA glycosylase AlkD
MIAGSKNERVTASDIVAAIRDDLRNLPARTTPAIRMVRRRHARTLADEPSDTVLSVGDALLDSGEWAERLVAAELLVGRRDALGKLKSADVERWAKDLADWGSVDMYGVTVAGVAWREGRISDDQVMKWARSSDRWRRRLALVATVPLNSRARGGAGDSARTLRLCRALVDDRDDMIVKALSWALRELAKRDPGSVVRFIHDEGDRVASRVRREVTTKLETGRKVRRRAGVGPNKR